jgi:hypothetical protein
VHSLDTTETKVRHNRHSAEDSIARMPRCCGAVLDPAFVLPHDPPRVKNAVDPALNGNVCHVAGRPAEF